MTYPGGRAKVPYVGVGASATYYYYKLQKAMSQDADVALGMGRLVPVESGHPAGRHKVYIEPTLVFMMINPDPVLILLAED
ncbi:hypothetical protein E4U17_007566 [Claviceps sp. LM77 group G4]|nr:hypothetical protein E4U17_007566 [Claviceps sp. LM77 group G4]KAG6083672.1 hypothetical protein E4U16_003664 [Claviceps sp. LM84 group G4]KAG6086283.1 hypothetical protein E4U33_006781 [Claviceps sp. LM78 group G4]